MDAVVALIGASFGSPSAIADELKRLLPVSYTHLRAHETPEHLVCRLLLAKKKSPVEPLHYTSEFKNRLLTLYHQSLRKTLGPYVIPQLFRRS